MRGIGTQQRAAAAAVFLAAQRLGDGIKLFLTARLHAPS